jgi:hypothetical protein
MGTNQHTFSTRFKNLGSDRNDEGTVYRVNVSEGGVRIWPCRVAPSSVPAMQIAAMCISQTVWSLTGTDGPVMNCGSGCVIR